MGNLFVNSLHLVPDDELISSFIVRSVEHIVRVISFYIGGKENGAMTSHPLLC